jgi:phosphoglycolate phosphatase
MQKIQAVIFDLDGTLLNTLDDLADSCNEALRSFGFAERTVDEVRQFVGNGLPVLAELAIPDGKNNKQYDAFLAKLRECYAHNWQNKTKPYDGIIDMLHALAANDIRCGIVSNKPDAQVKELSCLYFKEEVSVAVGEREGIRRKPYPDSLNSVMEQLNVDKKFVVYVGDSDVDIHTAANADVACVSVSWGFRSRQFLIENGASQIITQPGQLLELLRIN